MRAQRALYRLTSRGPQDPKDADRGTRTGRETVVKLDITDDRQEILLRVPLAREQSDPA
jgi:hypothetical protein